MRRVIVSAPARLHLGFVGLYGCSADRFGALGVAIDKPQTRVESTESSKTAVLGSMPMKVQQYVDTLIRQLTLSRAFEISVSETIPAHIGLGSGTQLALAVATACIKLNSIDLPLEKLSSLLGRGDRSGIGTASFDSGGFLVDCAPENSDSSRSVATRIEFPENWRILLIFDDSFQGIHGISENSAFKALGGFSAILTQELHNVLEKQVLPALQKQDIALVRRRHHDHSKSCWRFFQFDSGWKISEFRGLGHSRIRHEQWCSRHRPKFLGTDRICYYGKRSRCTAIAQTVAWPFSSGRHSLRDLSGEKCWCFNHS